MRLGRRRLAEAGCSIPQIAAITAHSIKTIETILERYLIRTGGAFALRPPSFLNVISLARWKRK